MTDTPRFGKHGHRAFVGGRWNTLGPKQLAFLKEQGLQPQHKLLDVGCGCFRGGLHFIHYLNPGNYTGLDAEPELLRLGREEEVPAELWLAQNPTVICSQDFDFSAVPWKPDYVWAQSLFSHLIDLNIKHCLRNLRKIVHPETVFYATFFEVKKPAKNPAKSHPQKPFRFTRNRMQVLGEQTGWDFTYIGNWKHPRKQMMVKYTPKP